MAGTDNTEIQTAASDAATADERFWRGAAKNAKRASSLKVIGTVIASLVVAVATVTGSVLTIATKNDVNQAIAQHEDVLAKSNTAFQLKIEEHDHRITDTNNNMIEMRRDVAWIKSTLQNIADRQHVAYTPPP